MAEAKNDKKIDNDQKKAIEAVKNSVVSAGAGSGKTTVLSERFLNLIRTNGYDADKILTLTFTKKATVEMSDRIYKVLSKSAPEQAALFYKANIKTLDSYCGSVAKIGSHFYGISPDFTPDEVSLRAQVEAQSLPFILKHRDNEAVKKLVGTTTMDGIANNLFVEPMLENSTIAEPLNFEVCFRKQTEEIAAAWETHTRLFEDTVHNLSSEVMQFAGNTGSKTYQAISDVFMQNSLPEIPSFTSEDIWNGNTDDIKIYLEAAKAFKAIKKPGTLKGAEGWKEMIEAIGEEFALLASVYTYAAGFYLIEQLIPLFVEFQEIVNNIKRTTGFLSFKDISNMALCILRDHPEIRLLEKKKYRAIMIDEFQDNNSDQRDMLYLLAERLDRMEKSVPSVEELCPDKLFFVGDEKQSIYSFRGADVSVFRRLSDEFKDGNLAMHTNYRSHPALIAAFNTIFGGIPYPFSGKPADADALPSVFFSDAETSCSSTRLRGDIPDYEAVYHAVRVPDDKLKNLGTAEKQRQTYLPHVHFALYDTEADKNDPPDEKKYITGTESEIEWVARKIEELTHRKENPVKFSEIAVLIRKLGIQPALERSFLQHGIPYKTEAAADIFADGPVNDIAAFVNLCVNPADRCAYAHVLRSPFVNLSFEEVEKLLESGVDAAGKHTTFAESASASDSSASLKCATFAESAAELLSVQSRPRYLHAAKFYRKLAETSAYEPLTQTISALWYSSGYRYETMWNHTVEMFGKQYDLLFELARQCDAQNMNIAAFADYLNQYKKDGEKLDNMDIPLEQTDGVNIMTIHKSKGLEFDVVFVCGADNGQKGERNDGSVFSSREFGITVNTPAPADFGEGGKNYFFEKVKKDNILRKNAELRRLAYVALTRAKNELYITSGKYTKKDYLEVSENYCPGTEKQINSILQVIYPVLSFYMEKQEQLLVPDSENCAPFDVTVIPRILRQDIKLGAGRRNTPADKEKLIDFLRQNNPYGTADLIKAEVPERKYTNPSHLHETDDETLATSSNEGISTAAFALEVDKTIPYWEIGDIVLSTLPAKTEEGEQPEPKFTFANFGTIAHAYMEAAVTGSEPVIKERDLAGLENRKNAVDRVKSICSEMAEKFKESALGKDVAQCIASGRFIKAEYSFRSRLKNSILKGTIDLVFENPDGTYTIVDYKTNQSVHPEIYYLQLASYRQAVAAMLGVKNPATIKCVLYYLRFGQVVDITEECGAVEIE